MKNIGEAIHYLELNEWKKHNIDFKSGVFAFKRKENYIGLSTNPHADINSKIDSGKYNYTEPNSRVIKFDNVRAAANCIRAFNKREGSFESFYDKVI